MLYKTTIQETVLMPILMKNEIITIYNLFYNGRMPEFFRLDLANNVCHQRAIKQFYLFRTLSVDVRNF